MARCDFATWAPDGSTPGGAIVPRMVIMHRTAVNFDSHPHAGLEWHFEVDFSGHIDQLVDTERRADANLKANAFAISVEHWGSADIPLTDTQVASFIRLCRWAHDTHGIPLQRADRWDGSGIGYHTMWGAPSPWTPVVKSCPGAPAIHQFNDIIIPTLAVPNVPVEDDMEAAYVLAMHEGYFGSDPDDPEWDKKMVESFNYWLRYLQGARDLPLAKRTMQEAFAKTVGIK